jgi:hypothetical protein
MWFSFTSSQKKIIVFFKQKIHGDFIFLVGENCVFSSVQLTNFSKFFEKKNQILNIKI